MQALSILDRFENIITTKTSKLHKPVYEAPQHAPYEIIPSRRAAYIIIMLLVH